MNEIENSNKAGKTGEVGNPLEYLVSTFEGLSDSDSVSYQLALWVAGIPVHNPIRDECCPDFSCCNGKIAPLETRKKFAQAVAEKDEYTKMEMLGMFLGDAFSNMNIYVAGMDIPKEC